MAFDNIYVKGATSVIVQIMLRDSTTGMGKTGLTYASVTGSYVRPGATRQAISVVTGSAGDAYSSGKFAEVDATNMPGVYQFHLPDAALATGVNSAEFSLKISGVLDKNFKIVLIDANLRDAVHLGITALPNAAAGAATGLPLSVDASGRVDVLKINGTSQTAGDIKGTLGIPILATMSLDIASVKGAVVAGVAAPLTTTGASTLTTGTRISGTYANTYLADAVSEVFAPVNPAVGGYGLNLYYDFLLGTNQTVNTVSIFGNYTGAGRYCDLFAYNWVTSSWDQLSNSVTRMNNNNTEASFSYTLLAAHQKSDGTVRIAFKSPSTTTGDRLNVDQVLVNVVTAGASASQIAQAVWQFNLPSADVDNSAAEYLRYIFGNFHGYVASASDASHLNIASLPAVANLFVGYRLFIHFEASNIFEGALITAMDASGNITLGTALSATPVADDGIRIYATMIEPDVLTAMTAQGYTTTRAGYLDTLNGLVANVWGYATRVLTASTNIAGMAVNLTQILGAGLTGTAANIVGAFSKFFDKVSPTGTVNSLPDFVAGANGGLPTTNGTKVNQTVDLTAGQTIAATVAAGAIATDAITAASVKADAVTKIQLGLATPTNITAGTITNATNVTNDVGITQAAADKVWGTTARTLSSFGTLIADIWSYVTRTLTGAVTVGDVTLAASQPNYAPSKAGDAMALTSGERTLLFGNLNKDAGRVYYVMDDVLYGSDSNDGLTPLTPFRTLNYALSKFTGLTPGNNKQNDIGTIYVFNTATGNYYITSPIPLGVRVIGLDRPGLHVTVTTPIQIQNGSELSGFNIFPSYISTNTDLLFEINSHARFCNNFITNVYGPAFTIKTCIAVYDYATVEDNIFGVVCERDIIDWSSNSYLNINRNRFSKYTIAAIDLTDGHDSKILQNVFNRAAGLPAIIVPINNNVVIVGNSYNETDTALVSETTTLYSLPANIIHDNGRTATDVDAVLSGVHGAGSWGGGSSPTVVQIRQEMDSNSTKLAIIPSVKAIASDGKINAVVKFVDKQGLDANAGDSWGTGNSYLTIAKAISMMDAVQGGFIYVGPGYWEEDVSVPDNVTIIGKAGDVDDRLTEIRGLSTGSTSPTLSLGYNAKAIGIRVGKQSGSAIPIRMKSNSSFLKGSTGGFDVAPTAVFTHWGEISYDGALGVTIEENWVSGSGGIASGVTGNFNNSVIRNNTFLELSGDHIKNPGSLIDIEDNTFLAVATGKYAVSIAGNKCNVVNNQWNGTGLFMNDVGTGNINQNNGPWAGPTDLTLIAKEATVVAGFSAGAKDSTVAKDATVAKDSTVAKEATVVAGFAAGSKPGTAQTITPPTDMALNSTVAKEATVVSGFSAGAKSIDLTKLITQGFGRLEFDMVNSKAYIWEIGGGARKYQATLSDSNGDPVSANTVGPINMSEWTVI